MDQYFKNEDVYTCPQCKGLFVLESLNCGIFRHGIHKESGQQIDPHTSKEECDRLVVQNLIWGCGRPFRWDGKIFVTCEYL